MRKKKPSIRISDWLNSDVEAYKEDHKLKSVTQALHEYVKNLKQQIEIKDQKINTLNHALKYKLDTDAKNLVLKRDVGVIRRHVEKLTKSGVSTELRNQSPMAD
jgi:hypothetical protein